MFKVAFAAPAPMQHGQNGAGCVQKLYASGSNTEFKEQDTQVQFETVAAQLNVAKATQESAKLPLDSQGRSFESASFGSVCRPEGRVILCRCNFATPRLHGSLKPIRGSEVAFV
jgi:hypothetical protein